MSPLTFFITVDGVWRKPDDPAYSGANGAPPPGAAFVAGELQSIGSVPAMEATALDGNVWGQRLDD